MLLSLSYVDEYCKVTIDFLSFFNDCRGGDDTQKGLNDEPPLESRVAATQT